MTCPKAIVIGVSAGAVEALSVILSKIPKNYSVPIIIVVHLPPDKNSLMAEVLQAKCLIQVKEAEDKEIIKPGVIYIAPPNYHLLVEKNNYLSLSGDKHVLYSRPSIDVLFETAADAYTNNLIGIILTGANSDGSQGLNSIEKAGGKVIVQRPDLAYASAMPQAALKACPNALTLSLEQITEYIREI